MAAKKANEKEAQEGQAQEATEKDAVLSESAPEPKLDQAVPGGRYIVNGVVVNCDGEPIEE